MLKNLLSVAAALLLLRALSSAASWACSCAFPLEDDYPVVFEGVVLGSSGCGETHTTRFEVTEAIKGTEVGEVLRVEHGTSGPSCGVVFEPDEVWQIFAHGEGAKLSTGLCGVVGPLHH